MTCLFFRVFHLKVLKTIVLVAIAIAVTVGIVVAVFVVGGQYQQELFEEYLEDSQKSSSRLETSPNLPKFNILP
jgi:Gpi18-like mannosyltransferase